MVEREMINTDSEMVKYCLLTLLMKICEIGMKRFISAWNCHHLPLRGIPNLLQSRCNRTTAMHQHEIPSAEQAADDYRQQGGNLSDPHSDGSDPMEANELLFHRRNELFAERLHSSFLDIFSSLLVGNKAPFEAAIMQYISITEELST